MGVVNLGQVAALIQSVTVKTLPEGAIPTLRNVGTKANAELVFGLPEVITTAEVQELVNTKLIEHYKNGYIQWPGMKSPLEIPALHFEGYSWYEVNYRGNFFRAKGDNANPFNSKKLTKEQIKNGEYIFKNDEQGDAIRSLFVKLTALMSFNKDVPENYYEAPWETDFRWGASSLDRLYGVNVLAGVINSGLTAEENRPRNLTFTIWALVKDE